MAECIVEVCKIESVAPHPNADALELSQIKGWQCIVPLGKYKAGDLVTYVPIDSMVPVPLAEQWGISKYLSLRTEEETGEVKGRVRCARLRGEPSFGVIIELENPEWTEGENVREHYGITKYIPPVRLTAGDAAPAHPLFVEYTGIENLRNFPDIFLPGEIVSVTEKIHGSNGKIGLIEGEVMAGSHKVRRKRPEDMTGNTYWFPYTLPGVVSLINAVGIPLGEGVDPKQTILFGEIYGSKIQDLHYGQHNSLGFRAFDLLIDGKYQDTARFQAICRTCGIETVPVLYEGPFDIEIIKKLSNGQTTLPGNHIREGVVIKPIVERTDPKIGRVILKYIGDQYLFSKSADKDTSDI